MWFGEEVSNVKCLIILKYRSKLNPCGFYGGSFFEDDGGASVKFAAQFGRVSQTRHEWARCEKMNALKCRVQ